MSNKKRAQRSTDPRRLGGDIAGPGGPHDKGMVVHDASRAIILDHLTVSGIDPEHGGRGQQLYSMLLSGRINQSTDRAKVMVIMPPDGVAAVITELVALGHHMPEIMLKCAACGKKNRRQGQYLCGNDWYQLPAAARNALWKKDEHSTVRLVELTHQIHDGVPLSEIRITP